MNIVFEMQVDKYLHMIIENEIPPLPLGLGYGPDSCQKCSVSTSSYVRYRDIAFAMGNLAITSTSGE